MWLENEDPRDPYGRTNPQPTDVSVGAGGGVGATPNGHTGTGGNPSTISPVQSNQPNQQFASVQDYLGANKQQGEGLGSKVVQGLDTSYTGEKSAIDTAGQQSKSDVTAGTPTYNPALSNAATTTPAAITGNAGQLQDYLKQWNSTYTGPQSFETSARYTPAATAASEANTKAQELATTGGQQQLLQDQFNVYGQGNKGLDQAILQNSSWYPKLQEQQKQFGTMQDYLTKQSQDVNAAIPQAKVNAAQTQAQTRGDFNKGLADFGKQLEQEQQTIKTTGANATDNVGSNFLSRLPPNPTDSDLAQAGMTRGEYEGILKTIPAKSTNPNISNPLYEQNPQYKSDLEKYLAMQNLQKQVLASQR
jgi:hypothetical protein